MLLLAIVGALLLLACVNVAGLLLARSAGRQREIAVRVGLGAGRGRLVRQMLTESVVLSAVGTIVGIAVAYLATGALVRILASGRAFEHIDVEVHSDLPLMLATAGIALITGLLFGLAPAWYAFHAGPGAALRQAGRGGDTRLWRLFGKGLVAAQVALSILLVSAAALFLTHLWRLRHFDLGFRSDHVLLMRLDPPRNGYRAEQMAAPYREILRRFEAIPGVRSASITGCAPLEGCGSGSRYLNVPGRAERPEDGRRTLVTFVAPRYFETLGIPLVAGHDFSFRDMGRARVAIVNESMARYYFPGMNPIGKFVTVVRDPRTGGWFGDDSPYEIIGLATDVKSVELRDAPMPGIYFNMFQENRIQQQFELRTSVDPEAVAAAARRLAREVLPGAPVKRVATLEEQVDSNIVPERLVATLAEFFGGLGVALAGVGLYGLLAYTVSRRTNEIGVRIALGATAHDVIGLMLRDAFGMVAAGMTAGVWLVWWCRPLAGAALTDLRWDNSAPLVIGCVAMMAVGLAAAYLPVRRAVRVDPMEALRYE